jgi:hypothetical protein
MAVKAFLKKVRTRAFWNRTLFPVLLMATGAYLLVLYLEWDPRLTQPSKPLVEYIGHGWYLVLMAWIFTSPRSQSASIKDPSPASSGTAVVIATGGAAAVYLARGVDSPVGYIVPAAVVLITAAVAFIVYRFATKHGPAIGEARFDTSN